MKGSHEGTGTPPVFGAKTGSVPKAQKLKLLAMLGAAIMIVGVACDRPPMIERVEVSRDPIHPSDTATLTAVATSPIGEALTYQWIAIRAASVGMSGREVPYTASKLTGTDSISLRVLDAHAREDTDTVLILVVPH